MQIERKSRRSQNVNLTPLIDVVFLLVVFFMLSTSFVVSEAMELNIPEKGGQAEQDTPPPDQWVMRVHRDGRIYSDDEDFSVTELDRELRERLRDNPDRPMLVLALPGSSVQQLVNVLDIVHVNGAKQVQVDHVAEDDIGADVQMER